MQPQQQLRNMKMPAQNMNARITASGTVIAVATVPIACSLITKRSGGLDGGGLGGGGLGGGGLGGGLGGGGLGGGDGGGDPGGGGLGGGGNGGGAGDNGAEESCQESNNTKIRMFVSTYYFYRTLIYIQVVLFIRRSIASCATLRRRKNAGGGELGGGGVAGGSDGGGGDGSGDGGNDGGAGGSVGGDGGDGGGGLEMAARRLVASHASMLSQFNQGDTRTPPGFASATFTWSQRV